MTTINHTGISPPAHEKAELKDDMWPTKHTLGAEDGQIHVGAVVFYRGTRYYVVKCPDSWLDSYFVHICSKSCRIGAPQPTDCESFAVYADCLDLVVNAAKNPYGKKAPTVKSLASAERAKAGIRDVGDPVADLLRGLTLEEMFETAAKYLGFYAEELQAKYAHLDNGRKRMVLGNRMRAKFNKEGK